MEALFGLPIPARHIPFHSTALCKAQRDPCPLASGTAHQSQPLHHARCQNPRSPRHDATSLTTRSYEFAVGVRRWKLDHGDADLLTQTVPPVAGGGHGSVRVARTALHFGIDMLGSTGCDRG